MVADRTVPCQGPRYDSRPLLRGLVLAGQELGESSRLTFGITDRYSRYTIAIPTYKSLTGEGAAQLFFEHVVLIHGRGLSISIFSDRDPRFISAFFTEFFVLCGVKLSTTSGYRSTSNGLVERRNQDLEGRLRGHAFEPQKWLDKLPLAVYHLNSTTCRTLGVCPIEAECKHKCLG
jgi:hypothetical protein